MTNTRIIECEACEGTGRHLVYYSPRQGDMAPCNEVDLGRCQACSGRGMVEVETEPVVSGWCEHGYRWETGCFHCGTD